MVPSQGSDGDEVTVDQQQLQFIGLVCYGFFLPIIAHPRPRRSLLTDVPYFPSK